MNLKRILKILISVEYIAFLTLCCWSPNWSKSGAETSRVLFSAPMVNFESGSLSVNARDPALVILAEEMSRLDYFTQLSSLDLSGSTCYEEIISWAQAHPQVAVRYSVELPGGVIADSEAESLDLSALSGDELTEAVKLLVYLPKLRQAELGASGGGLSPQKLAALCASCPDLRLNCGFSLAGKQFTLLDSELDLRGLTRAETEDAALYLSCMRELSAVELGTQEETPLAVGDIAKLQKACPQAELRFQLELFGTTVSLSDTVLDLNHIKMDDEGAAVRSVISAMPRLKTLDMDYCGVSNEAMAAIRADFPEVDVIWRIWFGENYSVRTDTEKILASKPSVGGTLYDDDVYVLRYCTKVKYLDLGHNDNISDLSFTAFMPELEVLILAMNPVSDLSPLANCTKMEYLEIFSTPVSDLKPLAGLTGLHHLNLQNNQNLTDISPLYDLPSLERLWIGAVTPVPQEQVARMKELHPDCAMNTTCGEQEMGIWRYTAYDPDEPKYYWVPRYELLRNQLGYNYQEYSFYWLDPKCGDEAPAEYAGKFGNIYK